MAKKENENVKKEKENNSKKIEVKKKTVNKTSVKDNKKKINIRFIIYMVCLVLFMILIIWLIVRGIKNNNGSGYALDNIYNVYPEEVRTLYANTNKVSCYGDLYLDIDLDKEETSIDKLNNKILLDYVFSNLDKSDKLNNKITFDLIKDTSNELLAKKISFKDILKNYSYGGYTYHINGSNITREKSECKSDSYYVSYLYGYAVFDNRLEMDVDFGYVKDNYIYDMNNKRLGEYKDDLAYIAGILNSSPYYTYVYVKKNDTFKLSSVKLSSRS